MVVLSSENIAGPVIFSVMLESLALGAALAYLVFDGFQTPTINGQTFSQVAFAFTVSPYPLVRAARIPVAAALRKI